MLKDGKGKTLMILVPAVLHCDECDIRTDYVELVHEPDGYKIPKDASGKPTIPGWRIDYFATNGTPATPSGGIPGARAKVMHGSPTNPALTTCSDDCRKVINARERLEGTSQEPEREPIHKPLKKWVGKTVSGIKPPPPKSSVASRCPKCLFVGCMCAEFTGDDTGH